MRAASGQTGAAFYSTINISKSSLSPALVTGRKTGMCYSGSVVRNGGRQPAVCKLQVAATELSFRALVLIEAGVVSGLFSFVLTGGHHGLTCK